MKTYNKIYTVHAWKDNNKFFTVVQGEGGVKYPRLKIIDDNGSIDLTGASITYTATLPRGSEEIVDATIIDAKQGTVEFEIKSSMTICSGIAHGELNIVSDSKVLKVGGVNLTISSATNGHEIEASEQFSALVEALRKVVMLTPEGTAVIPDGNITTEKLADEAVTKAKLSSDINTLAGYGITDAYTKEEVQKRLARKLDSKPFDSEPKNNSPCYLTSGAVYNALLVKADKTALSTKYDSSNIESGTSTLTPYSTVADKIKSANCTYKTIGDIVIVSATVKMNAVSLAGNSMCLLIDLPYKCISEDNVFCVGISNLGKLFKFAIPKNNTWLQFSTQDKTAYTFADGEQINAICLYKIK